MQSLECGGFAPAFRKKSQLPGEEGTIFIILKITAARNSNLITFYQRKWSLIFSAQIPCYCLTVEKPWQTTRLYIHLTLWNVISEVMRR